MTTTKVEVKRIAKRQGDKVIITSSSNAVDEQTIGEFRTEYSRRETMMNQKKDELKDLKKNLGDIKGKLKKEDAHLLQKMKPKVTMLMQKEFLEKREKELEDAINTGKKEMEGLKSVYDELTAEEMKNRKSS